MRFGTFFFFGAWCIIMTIFIYFFLPGQSASLGRWGGWGAASTALPLPPMLSTLCLALGSSTLA